MKKYLSIATAIIVTLLFTFTFTGESFGKVFRFSGGPSGGTFQYYASAVSTLAKRHKIGNVLASSSGGSIENIRLCNSGKANFAV
ncbi:MAG: C4-dicarboxylate ABC transporter substrate-binding protein, partial [Deltaproteobacteria bacterium]|nr:C4-dicarboxylate ABC transporter substrate-binding protein [Deltaproteobacteria bacterium]